MDNLELLEKLAQVMGVPTTEIKAVEDTAAGIVARMFDGSSYIKVPKDNPDSEGKTGLMYLRAPTEKYNGTFPVFAGGAPADTPPAATSEAEPAEATTTEPAADEAAPADTPPAATSEAAVPVKAKTST